MNEEPRAWAAGPRFSGRHQDFGLLPGEVEQAKGGAGRSALALLPTSGGSKRNVQKGREDRLTNIELVTNFGDFFRFDRLNRHRKNEVCDSHSHLLLAFEIICVASETPQKQGSVKFNLLRRMFS